MKTNELNRKLRVANGFVHHKFIEQPNVNLFKAAKYSIANAIGIKRSAKRLDKFIENAFANSEYSIMIQNIPRTAERKFGGMYEKVDYEHIVDSIFHYTGIQVSDDVFRITGDCYLFKTECFFEAKYIVNTLHGMCINGNKLSIIWSPNYKFNGENEADSELYKDGEGIYTKAGSTKGMKVLSSRTGKLFMYLSQIIFLCFVSYWFATSGFISDENSRMLSYGFNRFFLPIYKF
jgi:hypothetical protein